MKPDVLRKQRKKIIMHNLQIKLI